MMRYRILVIILFVFLTACRQDDDKPDTPLQISTVPIEPATAAATVVPTFTEAFATRRIESRPCLTYNPAVGEEEGQSYKCGIMYVPQDRSQVNGREIAIKYAILKSFSEQSALDPMLFLSGGPGNSALYPDGFVELAQRFAPMRQKRDIILFDQRGVGATEPAINCSTVAPIEDEGRKAELLEQYELVTGVKRTGDNQFTVDCVLSLWDQGVDLSQYTSVASAADTVDLMRALQQAEGYKSYNLYGISYGTRLAETIARDFAELELIRTISMDSVFPRPEGEYEASYYIGKHEMFESVFEACTADTACNEAYPNLTSRFRLLVERLNSQPMQLPDNATLSGDELYQFMFPFEDRGPDWVPRIPYLPRMIIELESGNAETYTGLRDGTLPPQTPSPDVPESVFESMDLLSSCTAVIDETRKNDLYRQLFNILPEKQAEIINQLCTREQAQPVLAKMEAMESEEVNEVVKRLYISAFRGSSPFVRTQFNCNEAFPFGESPQVIESKMRESGMPVFLIDEAVNAVNKAAETCKMWPSGAASSFEIEPINALSRALLLNGQWDYVTYPKWAEAVHQRWPASDYAFIPNGMHSLLSNYGDCPTNITLQFLSDPAQPVDISCTADMKIKWVLP